MKKLARLEWLAPLSSLKHQVGKGEGKERKWELLTPTPNPIEKPDSFHPSKKNSQTSLSTPHSNLQGQPPETRKRGGIPIKTSFFFLSSLICSKGNILVILETPALNS